MSCGHKYFICEHNNDIGECCQQMNACFEWNFSMNIFRQKVEDFSCYN